WLHGGDPLGPLSFETALAALKEKAGQGHFEAEIRRLFLENTHRLTTGIEADPEQGARDTKAEADKLAAVRAGMDDAALKDAIVQTERLKALQEEVDKPEDLAKIPTLTLADLDREIR